MFCAHVRGFCRVELFEAGCLKNSYHLETKDIFALFGTSIRTLVWHFVLDFKLNISKSVMKLFIDILFRNTSQKFFGKSSVTWGKRCLHFLMGNLKLIRTFQRPYIVKHDLFLGMCLRVTCMMFRLEQWTMFWVQLTDALHLSKVIIIFTMRLLCTLSLRTLSFKNFYNRSCVCFEV